MTCNLPKFCKHLTITGRKFSPRCKLGYRVIRTHSTREIVRLSINTDKAIPCDDKETK